MKLSNIITLLLLLTQASYSQDFITQWTFFQADTNIRFDVLTTDTVHYTWTTSPSGNSGSGSFVRLKPGEVVLTGLDIKSSDTLTVKLKPENLSRFYIDDFSYRNRLRNVLQWGDVSWTSMSNAFRSCTNLIITATDTPDLSNVTDLSSMFDGAESFNQDISDWDVSSVFDMSRMFREAKSFNQDIGGWDVSNVNDMSYMFDDAIQFNQDIGYWDVSSVNDMNRMFREAKSFNHDIGDWDVSSVIDMSYMFENAIQFNQDIGGWNVSNVSNMSNMFYKAYSFNQDIGSWDVSSVYEMRRMFRDSKSFNQDIGDWDVSNVFYMSTMFAGTDFFNGDIGGWNVSNVIDMSYIFFKAQSFNQDIGDWDVANVENMRSMFFGARSFNQEIGNWNVSNAHIMEGMFYNATSFNQNIGSWTLNPFVIIHFMLDSSGMDCDHYSATLTGWQKNNSSVTDITLGASDMEYGTSAIAARDILINRQGWTINGDKASGMACNDIMSADFTAERYQIDIYPNPTSNRIFITGNQVDLGYIRVYNSVGQNMTAQTIIDRQSVTTATIDISELNSGIYILRTSSNSKIVYKE